MKTAGIVGVKILTIETVHIVLIVSGGQMMERRKSLLNEVQETYRRARKPYAYLSLAS